MLSFCYNKVQIPDILLSSGNTFHILLVSKIIMNYETFYTECLICMRFILADIPAFQFPTFCKNAELLFSVSLLQHNKNVFV